MDEVCVKIKYYGKINKCCEDNAMRALKIYRYN